MYLSHLLVILLIVCWLITSTLRAFLVDFVLHFFDICYKNFAVLSILQGYIEVTCGWFSSNLTLFVMNLVVNLHATTKSIVCLSILELLIELSLIH